MQNKKSRKAASEVNRMLDPSLKETDDYIKKNGPRIPKKRRDFSRVAERLDSDIKRKIKNLPADLSPFHYLTAKQVFEIAYRGNETEKEVKCPSCKDKFKVPYPHVKAEANSITCLMGLMDRMYPKLGPIPQEANLTNYMKIISDCIVDLVVKYVPQNKKPDAMAKISKMFEILREKEAGNATQQTEDEAYRLFKSVA